MYTKSFDISGCNIKSCQFEESIRDESILLIFSQAKEYFEEMGFVVFSGVFDSHECKVTRRSMWEVVEKFSPGLVGEDPTTWSHYKGSAGKYGLSSRGPCFHPTIVDNRQSPRLALALSKIVDTDVTDILVSHDRFTIYRSTQLDEDGNLYRTGKSNIHLDLNPWWWFESSKDILNGLESLKYEDSQDFIRENNLVVKSLGRHVQCVLNFADNVDEDGGTILVPGYHVQLEKWCEENKHLRKPLPWVTLAEREEKPLLDQSMRIAMREGSVLIWNQKLFHGTSPNFSKNCRMAQFLKAYSRRAVFGPGDGDDDDVINETGAGGRLVRRAINLRSQLESSGALDIVTPQGARLFGLDVLS